MNMYVYRTTHTQWIYTSNRITQWELVLFYLSISSWCWTKAVKLGPWLLSICCKSGFHCLFLLLIIKIGCGKFVWIFHSHYKKFIWSVCVCVYVCVSIRLSMSAHTPHVYSIWGGKKRALILWTGVRDVMNLYVAARYWTHVLGRAASALSHWAIFVALCFLF